jgi:hypothetical protein
VGTSDGLPVAVATVGNAALLGLALHLAGLDARRPGALSAWAPTCLLLLAGAASLADARAQWLYLVPGAWLARLGLGGHLAGLAVRWPRPVAAVGVGALLGGLLGSHLLLTAARTLGHGLRRDGLLDYLGALAYDAGANIPATEALLRGVLFDRLHRRSTLAVALGVTTGASVARYVMDPLLPKTLEVVAGAIFYVSLLGLATGWLRWWSGSLLPGLAAALAFFAAYRLLDIH